MAEIDVALQVNGLAVPAAPPPASSGHECVPNNDPSTSIWLLMSAKLKLDERILVRREEWRVKRPELACISRPSNAVVRGLEAFAQKVAQMLPWSKSEDRIEQHKAKLQNAAAGFILNHEEATRDVWHNSVTHYFDLLKAEGWDRNTEKGRRHLDDIAKEVALKIRKQAGGWSSAAKVLDDAQLVLLQQGENQDAHLPAFALIAKTLTRCLQEEMKENLRTLGKQHRQHPQCLQEDMLAWHLTRPSWRHAALSSDDCKQAEQELRQEGWHQLQSTPVQLEAKGNLERAKAIWRHQGQKKGIDGTCGICAVAFVAQLFGRENATEAEVVDLARRYWLCSKDGGTAPLDQQILLRMFGIKSKHEYTSEPNTDWNQLSERLASLVEARHGVLCSVNAGVLWDKPRHYGNGHINHAITLVGTVRNKPPVGSGEDNKVVGFYVLDSGDDHGNCRFIPSDWLREAMLVPGGSFIYTKSKYPDRSSKGAE